jgi:hypothetical protein
VWIGLPGTPTALPVRQCRVLKTEPWIIDVEPPALLRAEKEPLRDLRSTRPAHPPFWTGAPSVVAEVVDWS